MTRELWKYVQTHKDRMIVNRTDIPTGSALKLLQPELAKIHHPFGQVGIWLEIFILFTKIIHYNYIIKIGGTEALKRLFRHAPNLSTYTIPLLSR